MHIAIIGFDNEGWASYQYYSAQGGHTITICDRDTTKQIPVGVASNLGDGYLDNLDQFDLLVRTAGLQPRKIQAGNPRMTTEITSCTNEFLRVCPSRNIIGVTGTKGKGTTSSLIAALLQASGKRVHLGGNIGVPALDLLQNDITPDDWVVLELSSFQLIDLQQSPHIAVCLMVVPEHLDWHSDVEEYYAAKQQLFRRQTEQDVAIYYAANEHSTMIASAGQAVKLPYMQSPGAEVINDTVVIDDTVICHTNELQLLGKHNWQNVCAALTVVWQISQDVVALHDCLTQFTGLEHRLELVSTVDDVAYYDDSFGTTPETAMVALAAFEQPKVVILGGSDKGADYQQLTQAVSQSNVRQALLIGQQAERIQAALQAVGFANYQPGGTTMADIVIKARTLSQPGDVVLLSTACASFDMFKNYKDRGDQFKTAVQSLAATGQSPAAPAA